MVKWDGYDVSESTWEPEDHIPACILSSFVPTEISQEKMKHFSTVFERAIQNRLTSKSPKNVVFVEFDVFRFLFGNVKSVLCDLEDLDRLNMPPHWFYKLHADGYGCKIKFPIRLTIRLRFRKLHVKSNGLLEARNLPLERLTIFSCTEACSLAEI